MSKQGLIRWALVIGTALVAGSIGYVAGEYDRDDGYPAIVWKRPVPADVSNHDAQTGGRVDELGKTRLGVGQ